jgi:selenocysteine lyase/cysteine desulfurase
LTDCPGACAFLSCDPSSQTGVLSFQLRGKDCEEIGEWLAQRGIAVRAGLHCAPLAHESAGTLEKGTVRVSVSAFNSQNQVEIFIDEIKKLCR